MVVSQRTVFVLAALIAAAIVAATGSALASYISGEQYSKQKPLYQLGYAVGAIDMLTELQGLGSLQAGPLNDAVAKIAQCLIDKKVKQSEIAGAYVTYLQQVPKSRAEQAPLSIFEAVKAACHL